MKLSKRRLINIIDAGRMDRVKERILSILRPPLPCKKTINKSCPWTWMPNRGLFPRVGPYDPYLPNPQWGLFLGRKKKSCFDAISHFPRHTLYYIYRKYVYSSIQNDAFFFCCWRKSWLGPVYIRLRIWLASCWYTAECPPFSLSFCHPPLITLVQLWCTRKGLLIFSKKKKTSIFFY